MNDSSTKSPFPKWFPFRPSWQFIFYSVIGVSGVALDYALYALLLKKFGWHYLTANVLSTSIGITNNFVWNALLNFKVRDRFLIRFLTFYSIGILGLVVTMALLWAQVEWFAIHPLVAKFTTIIIVLLLQYNLNRRLSFRKSNAQNISKDS